jgi:hypothetical protein
MAGTPFWTRTEFGVCRVGGWPPSQLAFRVFGTPVMKNAEDLNRRGA